MREKHDPIECPHIAQTIKMRDQPRCQRHSGQPQRPHDDRKDHYGFGGDRHHNKEGGGNRAPSVNPRQEVFLGIGFSKPPCRQSAGDIGQSNQRDRHSPKGRSRGYAHRREHGSRGNRPAHFRDHRGKMRGDKRQLVPAAEKSQKDEGIRGIFGRFSQDMAHALLEFGFGRGGRTHHWQYHQCCQNRRSKHHKDRLPRHKAQ